MMKQRVREHKNISFKGEYKEDGTFTGILSTFGNVDSYNDTVQPGAYKKTLKEKERFPLFSEHWEMMGSFTGEELDIGLQIKARINLDLQIGREKHSLILNDGLDGLSIGYDAVKWSIEERDGVAIRVLKEIKLYEGSVVVFPADEHARILAAKSAAILGDPSSVSFEEWLDRLQKLSPEQKSRILSLLNVEPGILPTPGSEEPKAAIDAAYEALRRSFADIRNIIGG